jgi:anaerobic selenocysteine-containing dehydrogenase
MTNHWTDIGNASLVFVIGANPAENHPACMAHVNAARFDIHYDDAGNPVSFGRKARLIVVDPRKTRTAQQTENNGDDLYVRIRPGTDVAFMNGVLKFILDDFESGSPYNPTAAANFMAWHNGTATGSTSAARTFTDDTGNPRTLTAAELAAVPGFGSSKAWPKYTDSRVRLHDPATATNEAVTISGSTYTLKHCAVKSGTVTVTDNPAGAPWVLGTDYSVNYMAGTITRINSSMSANVLVTYDYKCDDYDRATMTTASGWVLSNMLVFADTVNPPSGDPTVYQKLKAHIAPYDQATAADICGCYPINIADVARAFIDNSRFADANFVASMAASGIDVTLSTYRSTTLLYAMGATQHTNGSQMIRDYAIVQSMMGNMGRPGGGINALRGIHNVQGSTDIGLLFDSIPAYSGNPATSQTYPAYSNALFGNRIVGTVNDKASTTVDCTAANSDLTFTSKLAGVLGNAITVAYVDPAANDAVIGVSVVGNAISVSLATGPAGAITSAASDVKAAVDAFPAATALVSVANAASNNGTGIVNAKPAQALTGGVDAAAFPYTPAKLGLQQRGFYNMTREWFGDTNVTAAADIDKLWAVWPKGNGFDHITAFRNMGPAIASIKAAVVWGQNPAITEPNQSAVRDGLKNLDTLVCVDMFPNETVECERKSGGVTYFIPACSHVEEAGSVTNSGRWLQWRERATTPRGNSKADLELQLRFAKALSAAGAFSHIRSQWATMSTVASLYNGGTGADPWTVLYAKYGWDGVAAFDSATGTDQDGNTLTGSEYVADKVFWEIARPLDLATGGGTMWIYSGAGNAAGYTTTAGKIDTQPVLGSNPWTVSNRAKSRNNTFQGNARSFPRWGFAWLLNRRVFYNNGEVQHEVADNFVAPGLMARMFVTNSNTLADWSLAYRAYNTLSDLPATELNAGSVHVAGGRFPGHTEPTETPRDGADGKANLLARFGRNTAKGSPLYKTDGLSPQGTFTDYPLVLTTIRCVEHFQGGPVTRNNSWNVEAEPVPWIEIFSTDARKYGIVDGDWVNVITARSNSTTDQEAHTPGYTGWAKGFKARVGSGLQSGQRVAPGVVAIPWHWGDRGLSKGSRANDLTMDSWDANTVIPEYKACLCKIVKL